VGGGNMNIKEALQKALEEKGKKKFLQSVEMIINFRGIDFSKPENKINMEVVLPDKGKKNQVVFVGEDALAYELKKKMPDIKAMTLQEAEAVSVKELKKMAKRSVFYASPKIIGNVAKIWGKILGPRGKTPKPLINEKQLIQAKDMVILSMKGKALPTVQALIGHENQSIEQLYENANTILEAIKKKINQSNIKSIYFKLTMGKPVKVN
jgi:large subunit ribosomal protein L1